MTTSSQLSYWQNATNNSIQEATYTPTELWYKAADYFEWAEITPLLERKIGPNGGLIMREKMRLLSEASFCLYANISSETFLEYSQQEAFAHIINRIQSTIDIQNMEGAAAGLLNLKVVNQQIEAKKQLTKECETKVSPPPATLRLKEPKEELIAATTSPKREKHVHYGSKKERAAKQRRMALEERGS